MGRSKAQSTSNYAWLFWLARLNYGALFFSKAKKKMKVYRNMEYFDSSFFDFSAFIFSKAKKRELWV